MSIKKLPPPSERCRPPDSNESLLKFYDLIQQEEGRKLIQRQLQLLEKFFSATQDSVMISDLKLISIVLRYLSLSVMNEKAYKEVLVKLLSLLKHVPKLSKSSDKLNHFDNLVHLFTSLGNILHILQDTTHRLLVLDIIDALLRTSDPACFERVPLNMRVQCLELSYLPECLTDLLIVVQPELIQQLLNIILRICVLSDHACWPMIIAGAHETLILRLTPCSATNIKTTSFTILDQTLQILWKLFSCTDKPEDWQHINPLPNAALTSLRYVLQELILTNKKFTISKDSRNSFVSFIMKCMHIFPTSDWISSGIVEDMVKLFLDEEESSFIITNDGEDFQLQKLTLFALTLFPKTDLTLEIMKKYNVAVALIQFLNPGMSSVSRKLWSSEQIWDLFESTLSTISDLFSLIHNCLIENGLINRLLLLLEIFCNTDLITLNIVQNLIHLVHIVTLSSVDQPYIKEALKITNITSLMFSLAEKLSVSMTTVSQNILTHCLCILVSLLQDDTELLETFSYQILERTISLCDHILKPSSNDFLLDNRLILVVGNFIWKMIVWHKNNSLQFIKSGYIYDILDILELSDISLATKHVYLSLLIDLCTNVECVPYLVTWRNTRNSESILPTLVKLWRNEEISFGVERTKHGCLADIERPLMGEEQHKLTKSLDLLKLKSSPAILDTVASVRPKVFALVQIMKHHNEDITVLCEDLYRLGHNRVSKEDQITLILIDAYLVLKMGEIWSECEQRNKNVTPLNKYILTTLTSRYRDWSVFVKNKQLKLLNKDEELKKEEDYYKLIKSCNLTSALEALREIIHITKTSNRQFLLKAKEKQRDAIKIVNQEVHSDVQITYPNAINITTVSSGREVIKKYNEKKNICSKNLKYC
uniref:Cilia- and flagella-associated protein 69 ARM repeats domain-containing protein n=1 Tax=Clastoptera arizonana TaxID=38151 RepID=A0A1B6EFI0_9HEMI